MKNIVRSYVNRPIYSASGCTHEGYLSVCSAGALVSKLESNQLKMNIECLMVVPGWPIARDGSKLITTTLDLSLTVCFPRSLCVRTKGDNQSVLS